MEKNDVMGKREDELCCANVELKESHLFCLTVGGDLRINHVRTATVAELVQAADSKSVWGDSVVGSSPTRGTKSPEANLIAFGLFFYLHTIQIIKRGTIRGKRQGNRRKKEGKPRRASSHLPQQATGRRKRKNREGQVATCPNSNRRKKKKMKGKLPLAPTGRRKTEQRPMKRASCHLPQQQTGKKPTDRGSQPTEKPTGPESTLADREPDLQQTKTKVRVSGNLPQGKGKGKWKPAQSKGKWKLAPEQGKRKPAPR